MIRTQISLDRAQAVELKREAKRRGVSMSQVIRDAVAEHLKGQRKSEAWSRLMRHAGKYRSGLGDVSVNHDKYLNEGKRW